MDYRTAQVNRGRGWQEISFKDLCKGDNFMLFELNGDQVLDEENNSIFLATSNAYKNENGIWQIDTLK